MLGSKNNLLVDRRVYAFKGTWKDVSQDLSRLVYYYVEKPMTLVEDFKGGRETLTPQITINVFGEFPICVHDIFTLQNGERYKVEDITFNYFESNILVRDMLKQRVQSMTLTLQ